MSRYNNRYNRNNRGNRGNNNSGYNRLRDDYYDNNYGNDYYSNNYSSNYNDNYNYDNYQSNDYYDNGYYQDTYANNYQDTYTNNYSTPAAPEPALTKAPPRSPGNKNPQKIKSALFNPKVRAQLEKQKKYKPYFIYTVTVMQIILLLVSLGINYKMNGRIIEPFSNNLYVGPSTGVLVTMGARYLPCMLKTNYTANKCPEGMKGTLLPTTIPIEESNGVASLLKSPYYCTIGDICGFGCKSDTKNANQWFRFIIPIFLHGGLIHIVINIVFQVRAGISLEKDYGPWRIAIIYFASGIFGFMFEAKTTGNIPSVGCSGALYGLIAGVLLDLIQNWKLVLHPWRDLILLVVTIIVSLGLGLLPFLDNFSHIGGFIMGIFTSIIFLPSVIFNEKDEKMKDTAKIISIFFSIGLITWAIIQFYFRNSTCEWCRNLTCPQFIKTCQIKNVNGASH